MNNGLRTAVMIALCIAIVLLLWAAIGFTNSNMMGGMPYNDMMAGTTLNGTTWQWVCGVLSLFLGGVLVWMIFGTRK